MIERVSYGGINCIVGYHTQEFRAMDQPLTTAIKCTSNEAWLGFGYYFWADIEFAHYWGKDFKTSTGQYDIYRAEIDSEDLLDACFSEDGYFFFKESIDKAINSFRSKGIPVTLGAVQRYLVENFWPQNGVTGIIYDDLPQKINHPNRTYSVIPPLFYKKRIQIVVFHTRNIVNFEIFKEAENC